MQFQSLSHSVFVLLLASQLVTAAPLRNLEASGSLIPRLDAKALPRASIRAINVLNDSFNTDSPKNSGNNSNNNNNNDINSNHHNQNSPTTKGSPTKTDTTSVFHDEVFDVSQNQLLASDQNNSERTKTVPVPEQG